MSHSASVTKVIRVVCTIGTGSKDDPIRTEVEYWTLSGCLIVRFDFNDDPMLKPHP